MKSRQGATDYFPQFGGIRRNAWHICDARATRPVKADVEGTMRLAVSRFRLILSAVMMIPALCAEAFTTRQPDFTREDGLDY